VDKTWLLLLLFIAGGTILRFHLLGAKSLWLDEVTTYEFARLHWKEFLRTMWWGNGNMVLYYTLLRGWIHLGNSECALRSLSALGGIAAIPAVFAFGNRFLRQPVGLIAASLLALNSFHIQYSQELRSYSFLTSLLVLCAYAFLEAIEKPHRRSLWFLYILLASCAIYTQVFAVFVLASHWLVLPGWIKRVGISRLITTAVALGILTAPMAAMMATQNKVQVSTWRDFNQRPGLADLLDLFQRLVGAKAANAPSSPASILLLCLYIAAWALALWLTFRDNHGEAKMRPIENFTIRLLVFWLVFPILAMFGISLAEPIFHPRYLLMCLPGATLLAAKGFAELKKQMTPRRSVFLIALGLTLTLELARTWAYYASFATYGNDWRGVTHYLLANREPNDAVIFYTFTGHREFNYYVAQERQAGHLISAPSVLFPLALDVPAIAQRVQPYRRVWLVLHQNIPTASTEKQSLLIRTALDQHFHVKVEQGFPGDGAAPRESGRITVFLYVVDGESPSGPSD
jgi:uncharacterized membrane protein